MNDEPNHPPLARPWPCRMRRLTPDEVLAHLRAFCTDMMGLLESEVTKVVTPTASLRALGELASDFDWVDFGPYFGLELDQDWWDQWRPDTTVSDLCADLARRIEIPVFEPISLLGRECLTAGTFLAIRRMLAEDGADVERLGPSSRIAPYLRRHRAVFGRVRLASCGRLPHFDTPIRWYVILFGMALVLAGLTALFTWALGACGVVWPGSLLFALVGTAAVGLGVSLYARHHETPEPTDFRQLVFTLLGRTPRTA